MKPFTQGIKDFKKGNLENPFNKDTVRHREWERGFNVGYFENLERVQRAERKTKTKTRESFTRTNRGV